MDSKRRETRDEGKGEEEQQDPKIPHPNAFSGQFDRRRWPHRLLCLPPLAILFVAARLPRSPAGRWLRRGGGFDGEGGGGEGEEGVPGGPFRSRHGSLPGSVGDGEEREEGEGVEEERFDLCRHRRHSLRAHAVVGLQ